MPCFDMFMSQQIGIAGGGLGQAAAYIQDNYVPLPFVVMLLLQFLSMLVDRFVNVKYNILTRMERCINKHINT